MRVTTENTFETALVKSHAEQGSKVVQHYVTACRGSFINPRIIIENYD